MDKDQLRKDEVVREKIVPDTNLLLDKTLEQLLGDYNKPIELIIPLVVLEELDKFKKGYEIKNAFARNANLFLDQLREHGKLNEGVRYKEHLVRVPINLEELDFTKNDYSIIKKAKEENSTLVTKDINLRVISDALGVETKNYDIDNVDINELYLGYVEFEIEDEFVELFYEKDYIPISSYTNDKNEIVQLIANQFVIMKDSEGGQSLGIYKKERNRVEALKRYYEGYGGYSPKKDFNGNEILQQKFMYHLLLDPEIEFVSVIGPSGSGKTFGTFACALEQVLKKDTYNRITVMRTLTSVGEGNEIGFLPGTETEKLMPWMGSTMDTLEQLLDEYVTKDGDFTFESKIQELMDLGFLRFDALAFIRGRSIPNNFIIIDDAQNLSQYEATTIITRAGEGTKVIFLGDLSDKQIDNPRINAANSGLSYVSEKLKDAEIVGHISFANDPNSVVRSKLAQLGVERL